MKEKLTKESFPKWIFGEIPTKRVLLSMKLSEGDFSKRNLCQRRMEEELYKDGDQNGSDPKASIERKERVQKALQ